MVYLKKITAGVRKPFLKARLCLAALEMRAAEGRLKAVTAEHDRLMMAEKYEAAHQLRLSNFDLLDLHDQAAMRVVELARKVKALG